MIDEIKRWLRLIGYALALMLPGFGVLLYLRGKKRGEQDARISARADNATALGDTLKDKHDAKRAIDAIHQHAEDEHARINAERDAAVTNPEPTEDDVARLNKSVAELEREIVVHRSKG